MPSGLYESEIVSKTLIRNGYKVPKHSTMDLLIRREREMVRRLLNARRAFVGLRKRIVILLGIKTKRHKTSND